MTRNHLRTLAVALTAIILIPVQSVAQEQAGSTSSPELGVLIGLTVLV